MGCGSWGTLWHGIKGRKQRLSEFATLPIIQMIRNANYPPWLSREWPVTQDVARLCWALSSPMEEQKTVLRIYCSSTCCRTATGVTPRFFAVARRGERILSSGQYGAL